MNPVWNLKVSGKAVDDDKYPGARNNESDSIRLRNVEKVLSAMLNVMNEYDYTNVEQQYDLESKG